jgi:RNA polymerase sigma-70 factor (ECF subfamily)
MSNDDAAARRWAAVYAERHRLLRLARRRVLNEAEAEDCVSEAMLRCVEFRDLDEARLPAFLTSVTVRLCADQHRDRGRVLRAGGRIAGRTEEPSPEDGVCDRAEAHWVAQRIVRLPAHQRRVVEARAEGMSCAAVADRLGITVDAVKSAVARARVSVHAARDTACGAVTAFAARYRAVLELVATGGAVAGLALGGLVVAERPEHAPRPVAVAPDPAVPEHRVAAVPVADRRPAFAAAVTRATTTTPARLGPPAAAPPAAPHDPHPPTTIDAGPVGLHDHDEYSEQDRLMQCVTEGIELSPTIRCREPGDPR